MTASLASLAGAVKENTAESARFYAIGAHDASDFEFKGDVLTFRSAILTETSANNIVCAKVHEARNRRNAVVVLPHWNAEMWSYQAFCRHLMRLGLTTVELTLPYHGLRNRPGGTFADYFLSANMGRTIRSVRQAVQDTRKILNWLNERGYQNLGVIGISLGSCVAGLVAAHDARVQASAMLLTAGDFAEVVWTGRSTQHIGAAFSPHLTLNELRDVWSIISTGTFTSELSRTGLGSLIISASRDTVVRPYLTTRLVEQLRSSGAECVWRKLSCGHYSMAVFPFNAAAFLILIRFLRRHRFL